MAFLKKVSDAIKAFSDNYSVVDSKEYNTIEGNYTALMKSFGTDLIDTNGRPSLPLPYLDTPTGSKVPLWRLQPLRMFEMAENIGDLRAVHETIQREMFRNGEEVRAKFKYKCLVCMKTFKETPLKNYIPIEQLGKDQSKVDLKCDECGNEGSSDDKEKWSKPEPSGRVVLQTLVDDYVNNNNQKLIDVAKQYERDLDTIDYAITVTTRSYKLKILRDPDPKTGALKEAIIAEDGSDIDEFIRIHPVQVTMVANDEGRLGIGSDNKPKWICPNYEHRDKPLERPVCEKCGAKAFTAIMETNTVPYGLPIANPKKQWYAKHEVVWTPGKFHPDLLYGHSVLNAVWKKVMSLYHQDEYLWKYFDKERPPKSLLAIGSRNYETVQGFFERQRQGARADPYMPRPILLNTDNVSQSLQYVDLTPNFKELELTSLRQELRQIISSIYGVQPVFFGEQTKSGLGNESLQVTITNRTIKYYQRFLTRAFYGRIGELMGVKDWEIALVDSEEIDKLRDEQIRGTEIDNASKMYGMGFDVFTDGNGKFVFSQFPNPERQMMMGGVGSNVKQGNLDKTKSTKPPGEKRTNFGGEPLMQRPSDIGGAMGGSPSAGQSYSNKALTEEDLRISAREIIHKGIINNWTLTNMAKKFSERCGIEKEEALNIIKYLISNSV